MVWSQYLGFTLLTVVWGIAIFGMLIKAFWVTCPKWFSSVIYIAMGWVCIFVFGTLRSSLPTAAFAWLLVGGIVYTIGGVIYALKLPLFNSKHKKFDSHAVFHLFVMGGSICHFIFMYVYVAQGNVELKSQNPSPPYTSYSDPLSLGERRSSTKFEKTSLSADVIQGYLIRIYTPDDFTGGCIFIYC